MAQQQTRFDVDFIMAFEQGEATFEQIVDGFADGIRTGQVWSFQGMYGRTATRLIEAGFIDRAGNVLTYELEE